MLLQWNINGLRSHLEELKLLLSEQNPKILCIQETKLHARNEFTLRGYEVFRHDVIREGQACGGVAIVVDSSIPASENDLRTELQAVSVTISIPFQITICSLYIPPVPAEFDPDELKDLLNSLPRPYILLGDFNAHHPLWGSNNSSPRGNALIRILEEFNLVVLNNGLPTYLCPRSGNWSALDLSICSPVVAHRFGWQVLPDFYGSDHAPIKMFIYGMQTVNSRRPKWILQTANWNKYQETLSAMALNIPLDTDEATAYLTNMVITAAKVSIPQSCSVPKRPLVPWWNEQCSSALKDRRRALRRFKICPTNENLMEFRLKKAKARQTFKLSKRTSWLNYISSLNRTTPSSEVWRRVRTLCGRQSSSPILGLNCNGISTTDQAEIANILSSTFAEVSKTTSYSPRFQRAKIVGEVHEVDFTINNRGPLNLPFSTSELQSAIWSSSSSATGPDDIHYSMLKNLPTNTRDLLLSFYNKIFSEQRFPTSWGNAYIVPLHKPGQDKLSPTSYRPISLTSCLCKVLERMVNRRLSWYLEHNHLFAPQQCGFRQEHSTTDHLVTLETAILEAFAERKQLVAVFFDLRKAYDTAWRRGIINSLSSWGIGGNMLAFIDNFMNNRSIQVRLGNTLSDSVSIENGIPQGSVLSCTLFAIAINSITSCVQRPVRCSLFVDDFTIYVSAKRLQAAERCLQLTINRLEEWSGRTGFTFSVTKSQSICFTRSRNVPEPNLTLNGSPITPTTEIKFLGIIFDRRLTWIPHIKYLKSKCQKRINIMRVTSGTKWGADRTCMLRFYKAYIRSCLDYGSQVYSSARPSVLKMLDSVHNSAVRLATGAFRSSPIDSLLAEAGEPPLSHRRNQIMCNYICALKARPENPAHEPVFDDAKHEIYNTRLSSPRPFGMRALTCLDELGLTNIPITTNHQCDVPPWTITNLTIDTTLSLHPKESTPSIFYKQSFAKIIDAIKPCDVVYTDGSKTDQGSGCAFVTQNREYRFGLPSYSSVYTAELRALQKAVSIAFPRTRKLALASDSLSSILAIKENYSKHVLVREILATIWELGQRGVDVYLIWVPGHIGIHGNELADKAAKEATSLEPSARSVVHSDLKPVIKDKLKRQWNDVWRTTQVNKLRVIKDTILPWATSCRTSRREEVVLCRLRIGHTNLTHGYLMNHGDVPLCSTCQVAISIRHIFEDCPRFRANRQALCLPSRIGDILSDDEKTIRLVFSFLERSHLLSRI